MLEHLPYLSEVSLPITLIASFIGYFLFIYAIISALAATMAIFRIAGWLDIYHANLSRPKKEDCKDN